jgi:hypothetical protein
MTLEDAAEENVPMMSWQPRMTDRNWLIFGPRTTAWSSRDVRMWKESGRSSSMAAR